MQSKSSFTFNTFLKLNHFNKPYLIIAFDLLNNNIINYFSHLCNAYTYDQLNRLKKTDAYTGLNNATNGFSPVSTTNYKEEINYDANGNIQTYLRNGTNQGALQRDMDNLTYTYKPNTNQLDHVSDPVPSGNYPTDIDNQNPGY